MRCASCGFPLSPARKSCPRCGTAVAGKAEKSKNAVDVMQSSPQDGFGFQGGQADQEKPQAQWNQTSSATWDPDGVAEPLWDQAFSGNWSPDGPTDARPAVMPLYQTAEEAYGQQSFNNANAATLADQLPFPGNELPPVAIIGTAEPEAQQPFGLPGAVMAPLPNTPLPTSGWTPDAPLHASTPSIGSNSPSHIVKGHDSFLASKLTPSFGFTISGAFILTGTLLLIFVFLMSLSLSPSSSISSSQVAQHTPTTMMSTQNTPAATGTVTPVPTISPTVDATSAKQVINNAQTASTINTATATAIQVTTRFKVHQQIYVTFAVHTTQSGMACLLWFLNEKQFDQYAFAVNSVSTSAYSFTTASTPGSGYVQIYWATKPDCSDKVLAQQVNFTVV
jgi:predicted RNA-binding Zn-ribbon protein involved in translation (DUF1610 family)